MNSINVKMTSLLCSEINSTVTQVEMFMPTEAAIRVWCFKT